MLIYRRHLALLILFIGLFSYPFSADAKKLKLDEEIAYRVQYGNPADVKLLLNRGSDPDSRNELGWPLVSVAAMRSDGEGLNMLKLLIDAGADPNQGGSSYNYPIIVAARLGDVEMAEYLLEINADPMVRDKNGMMAYDIAKYFHFDDVAALFEEMTVRKIEEEEKRLSPKRYHKLLYDLSKTYCESQYMHYYFKSGQDHYSEGHVEEIMDSYRLSLGEMAGNLKQLFRVKNEVIFEIQEVSSTRIYKQLEDLISNRNRRKHGVGTEEDREKRCDKIATDWKENFDEREEMRKLKEKKRQADKERRRQWRN